MLKTGRLWITLAGMLALLFMPRAADALGIGGFSVTLGCTSYSYPPGVYTVTRNNTGMGGETTTIRITDGSGNVLYQGVRVYFGIFPDPGGTIAYTALPQTNPISYRWVSDAGNGFAEEVLHTATGMCPGLAAGSGPAGSAPPFNPNDGRIGPYPGISLNAYCHEYGFVLYRSQDGSTILELAVLRADIERIGIPARATRIIAKNGVELYRLPDGLFQLMDVLRPEGKRDLVIFEVDFTRDTCNLLRWRRGAFNTLTMQTIIYSQSAPEHWPGYPFEY